MCTGEQESQLVFHTSRVYWWTVSEKYNWPAMSWTEIFCKAIAEETGNCPSTSHWRWYIQNLRSGLLSSLWQNSISSKLKASVINDFDCREELDVDLFTADTCNCWKVRLQDSKIARSSPGIEYARGVDYSIRHWPDLDSSPSCEGDCFSDPSQGCTFLGQKVFLKPPQLKTVLNSSPCWCSATAFP